MNKLNVIVRWLTLIPIIVGIFTFIELGLPYKKLETEVISKRSEYRERTSMTTYTVNFKGLNDQFTESIYNALEKGDEVELYVTYFNKQIRELKVKGSNTTLTNSTPEIYAELGFAVAFLFSLIVWIKRDLLDNNKGIAFLFLFLILLGTIKLIRMFLF